MQVRPHEPKILDRGSLRVSDEDLHDLPWVRAKVASLRVIGNALEVEVGPYAGELWFDADTRLDVVELVPGTVAACLRLSRTGRRVAAQEIAGSTVVPPTQAVATAYAEEVANTVASGVRKEYVPHQVSSTRPRGKIDVAGTVRGPWAHGRLDRIVTRRRDLSDDNALNRTLLAACVEAEWRLRDNPSGLVAIRTAAAALRGADLGSPWSSDAPADHPARFGRAVRLARDVLAGVAFVSAGNPPRGQHSAWVNVERVFEEAVRTLFGHVFDGVVTRGEDEHVTLFRSRHADPPMSSKTANPDVVMRSEDGTVRIVDAKYRRTGEKPSDDAVYQLIAHADAYSADAAALLVPALSGPPSIKRLGRTSTGCTVDVVAVDPTSEAGITATLTHWLNETR